MNWTVTNSDIGGFREFGNPRVSLLTVQDMLL